MDKKQKTLFVSILIVLLLIVFLAGFTFAKYYTTYQANSQLDVAKWSFKVTGWSTGTTNKIHLKDTAVHDNKVDLADGKMAPGFLGKAELELDASDAEVDVSYYVEAETTGTKPRNLVFRAIVEEGTDESGNTIQRTTKDYTTLQELAQKELNGTIARSETDKKKTITIVAEWPYETKTTTNESGVVSDSDVLSEDAEDTQDGTNISDDYIMTLKVVGTQAKA